MHANPADYRLCPRVRNGADSFLWNLIVIDHMSHLFIFAKRCKYRVIFFKKSTWPNWWPKSHGILIPFIIFYMHDVAKIIKVWTIILHCTCVFQLQLEFWYSSNSLDMHWWGNLLLQNDVHVCNMVAYFCHLLVRYLCQHIRRISRLAT